MSSRHILTAPAWPYANGPRHIGHVSGFGLPAECSAGTSGMAGNNVLMVSGTDEHGTPIQVQADAAGVTARELADRYNRVIAEDLTGLDMAYDLFTRTTTRNHYAVTQEIFRGSTTTATSSSGRRWERSRRRPADAARPVHRGNLPICGYESARGGPVRQLRQPARPGRPDQPALEDQRGDPGLHGDRALLPRPARVRRRAGHLAAEQERALAPPTCSSSRSTCSTT